MLVIKKLLLTSLLFTTLFAQDDRVFVKLPQMMQDHMMSNMRDHLKAINEILVLLEKEEFEKAADVAEYRLGMSSLESHGASHMAKFMPKSMAEIGTNMHKAASKFALKAQEGDTLEAYKNISNITKNCVACHSKYRIK